MEVSSYSDLQDVMEHIDKMQFHPEPACTCIYREYNKMHGTYVVRVGVAYEGTDAVTLPSELQQWVRESSFSFARPCTLDGMLMVDVVPNTRIER